MSTVEVEELRKEFFDGKNVVGAVRDLSFVAEQGRVLGVLGPNGAGKTTTLRILSTALRPTAGSARVAGHDVENEPAAVRAQIGFLSGATGLYERTTAREMIAFFGELYGLSAEALERRTGELARWLDMESFLDRPCGRLSTGQKQKVGIARTVVHDPPILILDEPTTGLDILVARQVLDFIEAEKERGKTILYSTHLMSEVERLCDDLVIIDRGRRLYFGPAADLKGAHGAVGMHRALFALLDRERERSDAGTEA